MNVRQFINSGFCAFAEQFPVTRRMLSLLPRFLSPDVLRVVRFHRRYSALKLIGFVYILICVVVFGVQAGLSLANGTFWVDENPSTKNFLEDRSNLFHYLIVVEAYCIAGMLFLRAQYNHREAFARSGLDDHLMLPDDKDHNLLWDALPIILILLSSLALSAGYAVDVQNYTTKYWYMQPDSDSFGFAGYYYLFVNFGLMAFIVTVGFSHLGLFKLAGKIAHALRKIYRSDDQVAISHWANASRPRKWLAPLSEQILFSKLFALSLLLNIVSWKTGQRDLGLMYTLAVLILSAGALWIVTIPRYFIQYQIFKIREKAGGHEYLDLRMPWIIGWSAMVDLILVVILGKVLLNPVIIELLQRY